MPAYHYLDLTPLGRHGRGFAVSDGLAAAAVTSINRRRLRHPVCPWLKKPISGAERRPSGEGLESDIKTAGEGRKQDQGMQRGC